MTESLGTRIQRQLFRTCCIGQITIRPSAEQKCFSWLIDAQQEPKNSEGAKVADNKIDGISLRLIKIDLKTKKKKKPEGTKFELRSAKDPLEPT